MTQHRVSTPSSCPDRDRLKVAACRAVDAARDRLIHLAERVYAEPEVGFEEEETSQVVFEALSELGLEVTRGIAGTGLKAVKGFGRSGPAIGVIGELDALRVPEHESANAETGAAHACGHHAQLGQMVGAATALTALGQARDLQGAVAFIAAPAEEFIDVGSRLDRRARGEIGFLSGKQEMIRLGAFDDVDMAMMVHTSSEGEPGRFTLGGTSNAHVVHRVRFLGKAAHAGGAPWEGVNALQAATIALGAVNAQRETFQERHTVRVHGIITQGGASVNSVPSEVVYEGRVRARTGAVTDEVAEHVERCFRAGALAMNGEVEITRIPGYLALENDRDLEDVFARNAELARGANAAVRRPADANRGGSTDMGDLSQIMPVIHPYVTAASGSAHGADYVVNDYEAAVIAPAKVMAMTVIDLLFDGAAEAGSILRHHKPAMTARAYIQSQEARMKVMRYRAG